MSKQSKKLDLNQLAKRIIDEATGEIEQEEIDEKKKAAIESRRPDCSNKNSADENKA